MLILPHTVAVVSVTLAIGDLHVRNGTGGYSESYTIYCESCYKVLGTTFHGNDLVIVLIN